MFTNADHDSARGPAAVVRKIAAPWSKSPAAASAPVQSRSGRTGAIIRTLFFLGFFAFVIANNTDVLDPLLRQLRIWALQMGFVPPF